MKTDHLIIFAALLIGVIIGLVIAASITVPLVRPVPRCQEDVVLIGAGDFERGRWASYACGPAVDDYIGGY